MLSHDIKGGVSVSWRMIILQCGRDQCGSNAHSVDPHSMRIESWSSVNRPLKDTRYHGLRALSVDCRAKYGSMVCAQHIYYISLYILAVDPETKR